ncbi:MAG: D-glycero-beta-D-manno-heptose-7-phosphate kinase [Oligoflexia bacterium]|nr:D-glycero-beta-D-manno-heptose-7-phosphate kinase [Oligoflexia bacterium]
MQKDINKEHLLKFVNNYDKKSNSFLPSLSPISPILVLGDCGIDKYTSGEVSRISPEAPVAILEVVREWFKLGLAANINDNLKELGLNSTLLSVIGTDNTGDKFLSLLAERGLGQQGIVFDPNRKTTLKERVITKTQQICRIDHETKEKVSTDITANLILKIETLLSSHSGLIIEDYGKGLITEELSQRAIKIFTSANKIVTIDPSRSTPPHFFRGATLIKPNYDEAKILVAKLGYSPETIGTKKTRNIIIKEMAEILAGKLNISKIVITLGAEGMALLDTDSINKENFAIIPTVAKEVFDVSGAGDTVISVLTIALLHGANLQQAAWIANCAAGVVVGKRGTATVSAEELSSAIQKEIHCLRISSPP